MKALKDILYKTGLTECFGSTDKSVRKVHFDSRKVAEGDLFVAVPGTKVDGHDFIEKAVENGAAAIVCEKMPHDKKEGVTYVKVNNSSKALGFIASNYYDNPSSKLKLIGITGTNGKTTTVTLLHNLFSTLGYKAGMLSTVRNMIGDNEMEATHTTPDAMQLNELLSEMVKQKCESCFMEVSSHAVVQNRIAGLDFSGGVFTNISHEHLDYHKTFKGYIEAKKKFFDDLGSNAFALVNKDDKNAAVMLQNTKASKATFSLKKPAGFKAKIIESHFSGLLLNIDGDEVWTKLIGNFNAYNVLAAYAVATILGEDKMDILTAVSSLKPVEGRFQYIRTPENISGIVDYAHTPDALENVLSTIKEVRTGNEQVITVVGCGGDRDKTKRPVMAEVACKYSDRVVLTSDNPRTEEPDLIIEDMKEGIDPVSFKKVVAVSNRKEAIKTACSFAKSGDIVLVAGKGHEKYQEINGEKRPFDDLKILEETLKMMEK